MPLSHSPIPTPGDVYVHSKSGRRYQVLTIARHTESLDEHVVYQALYGQREIWARPLAMWTESVVIDGQEVHRFRPLTTQEAV